MLDKSSLPDIEERITPNPDVYNHIPISSHFTKDTLLTKDGSLIQIIEVSGFEDKTIDLKTMDLRETVRQAIVECVKDYKYAVYFHTIRGRKNLTPAGTEPFGFADSLNKKWNKKNNWDKQLANTLYISIVRQNTKYGFSLGSIHFGQVKKFFGKFFEKSDKELTTVVDSIISKLTRFGARKLTMLKTHEGYISEQLVFYHHLTHLYQRKTFVPIRDLAEYLANYDAIFQFNSLEIAGIGQKQFGAIFSIKEYLDLPTYVLDEVLQLGTQFIITQVMYFTHYIEAQKRYSAQYDFLKLTKEPVLYEGTGLKRFFDSEQGNHNDYCAQQTFILVHSDDEKFFKEKINQTVNAFRSVGFSIIREDFFLPKLFWCQLPGNFRYIEPKRIDYLNTSSIAGFSSVHYYLSGSFKGSKWGPPISLLRSIEGTPYYFNFHNRLGNGNTIFLGPEKSGKTVTIRFLIAQACKLNARVIYLDLEGKSKTFIEGMGGKYIRIKPSDSVLKVNPFNMDNYYGEVRLFKDWLFDSIYPKGKAITQYDEFFTILADQLSKLEDKVDKMKVLSEIVLGSNDQNLIEGYKNFFEDGGFVHIFNPLKDDIAALDSDNILGIDFSELKSETPLFKAFFGILLKKLLGTLDGKPTIINLNPANIIYDMEAFYFGLEKWLKEVEEKNGIALLSFYKTADLLANKHFKQHFSLYGTKMLFSDKFADKNFRKALSITEEELYKVRSYDLSRRVFMLKQDQDTLMLSLQLDGLKEELEILCS